MSRIKRQPESTSCALIDHYSQPKRAATNTQIADLVDLQDPVAKSPTVNSQHILNPIRECLIFLVIIETPRALR